MQKFILLLCEILSVSILQKMYLLYVSCISLFQLAVIERDKMPLSTYLAVKISAELQIATNITKNLYGSDILIVDRMLYHVLKYETQQGGLNLTHRQDKDFIQVCFQLNIAFQIFLAVIKM